MRVARRYPRGKLENEDAGGGALARAAAPARSQL